MSLSGTGSNGTGTLGVYENDSHRSAGIDYEGPPVDHSGLVQRRDIELDELPSTPTSYSNPLAYPQESAFTDYPEGAKHAWSVVFRSWWAMTVTFGVSNTTGFMRAYLKNDQLKEYTQSVISWIFGAFTSYACLVVFK